MPTRVVGGDYGRGRPYGRSGPQSSWKIAAVAAGAALVIGTYLISRPAHGNAKRHEQARHQEQVATTAPLPPASPVDTSTAVATAFPRTEEGALDAAAHWAPLLFSLDRPAVEVVTKDVALPDSALEGMTGKLSRRLSQLMATPGVTPGEVSVQPLVGRARITGSSAHVQLVVQGVVAGAVSRPGGRSPIATIGWTAYDFPMVWSQNRWWLTTVLTARLPGGFDTVASRTTSLGAVAGWASLHAGYAGRPLVPAPPAGAAGLLPVISQEGGGD